jgi:hypothetical protein
MDRTLLVAPPAGKPAPAPEPAPKWEPAAPARTFPPYQNTVYFPWEGPEILVRFPDGVAVEFRPGSPYFPRNAKVSADGIDIKGQQLDFKITVKPDGELASVVRPWKTGVAGIDGAEDVTQARKDAVAALCRKRAKEARQWLNTALRGPR